MKFFSSKLEKIVFVTIIFYFFCIKFIVDYFFIDSRFINSIILVADKEISPSITIRWENLREEICKFDEISSKDKIIYYYNFNDYKKVNEVKITYSENTPVKSYLGKKLSIFKSPIPFLNIKYRVGLYFDIAQHIYFYKNILFFIFTFIDIIILLFLLKLIKKDRFLKIAFFVFLFLSSFSFSLVFTTNNYLEKIVFYIVCLADIFIGTFVFIKISGSLSENFGNIRRVLISLLISILWVYINFINLKSITTKTFHSFFVVKSSLWRQENRNLYYYRKEYGHLYEYGKFLKSITTNSRIIFPSLTRTFGNGAVIRYFIYPNVPVMVPKEYCYSKEKFVKFLKENELLPCYIAVLRKGMDIWGSDFEWPSFQLYAKKEYTLTNKDYGDCIYSILYLEEASK
ncbi:MAG: hypothetical protein WHS77_00335 [Brevinematales bacterium]